MLPAGEKPHKCELCDFTCRDVSYLSKHMLTHSNDKNFMCTECGYITKWKHYLNVHMRKHTGDLRYDPGLPISCPRSLLLGAAACARFSHAWGVATTCIVWCVKNAALELAGCCWHGAAGAKLSLVCLHCKGCVLPRQCRSELRLMGSAALNGPRLAWAPAELCQNTFLPQYYHLLWV